MEILTTDKRTGNQLILGRGIPFWAVMAFLFLLLITLLIYVASTALVRVNYSFSDESQKENVQLISVGPDLTEKKVGFVWGDVAAIPRDTQLLLARSEKMETRVTVDNLPVFGIASFDIVLHPQVAVSKLGFDALGCNMTNGNGAFTYGCNSVGYISKINRPENGPWTTDKVPSPSSSVFERYKDGFLVFQYVEPQINYFVPGGDTKDLSLPNDFVQRGEDQVSILSNQTDPNDDTFVVADFNKGEFAYLSSLEDKNPKRFSKKADTDIRFNTSLCAKASDNLICYYGPATNEETLDDNLKLYRNQHPRGVIEVISLKDTSQSKIYKLSSSAGADNIYLSASGTIYLLSNNALYDVKLEGDSAKLKLAYSSVDSVGATTSGSIFVSSNNKVVEINEKEHTSYLRFQSDNLATARLSVYGDTVLMNAFLNTDEDDPLGAYAHVYRLTDKPLTADAKRKEDILPYRQLPQAYFMDYGDDRIFVTLRPIYVSNDDGTKALDQTKMEEEKAVIQKRLSDDGLLTNGIRLQFSN